MLKETIGKIIHLFCKFARIPFPEGHFSLILNGHRNIVGGRWSEIGKLQFDFMVRQGLKPNHVLMDIGCGSLRGGVHFIEYLDKGNYLGIDKNESWVNAGLDNELPQQMFYRKQPEFVFSENFEFSKFSKIPNFAIAQSLFTHLDQGDIELCLKRLREFVNKGFRFYATFFETNTEKQNHKKSHSHSRFQYTQNKMCAFGEKCGWKARYIGDWNHPRGQKMIEYTAA